MLRATLRLGHTDAGGLPASPAAFFRPFSDWSSASVGLRDEADGKWRPLQEVPGGHVATLQTALRRAGFLPYGPIDGVFGYRTRAAVRLFQEYARVVESNANIGTPDGIVGANTWAALDAWGADGRLAAWQRPDFRPDPVVLLVRTLLKDTLLRQAATPDALTQAIARWKGATATLEPDQWSAADDRVHLVGIRRNASARAPKRSNDDLFVLMAAGMTFLFVGSTDPNPSECDRADEPYLVRGQHRYRLGWHKLNPFRTLPDGTAPSDRAYLALKPADAAGVLVVRDRDRDDAFSPADIAGALEANGSINVHWSGKGTTNWSAGCQVVAGARYIDFQNHLVDCTPHAATSYGDLTTRTRGAWNVLIDALIVSSPDFSTKGGTEVLYTLLYEEDLDPTSGVTPTLFRELVERLHGRRSTPVPLPGRAV